MIGTMTLEQPVLAVTTVSGTDSDNSHASDPGTAALADVEKLYECDECGQRFTREYYVQRHKLAVHTENKPFKCTQCDRTFSQGQGLARHMISHTGEKKFVCERCNKTFGFKSNLDRHKRNICYKHELHNPTVQIPGVERRFKCDLCDKSFSLKSNFERHKRTVCFRDRLKPSVVITRTAGNTHKCDVCQKVFGTPFNLQRHQKAVCYKDEFQNMQQEVAPVFTVKEELKFAADQDYNNESEEFSAQDYQQQYEAISSAIKDEFGDMTEDYDSVDFTSPEYKTELENEMSQIASSPGPGPGAETPNKDSPPPVPFTTVTGADGKEKKIYKCERCSKTFGFRHNLDRHMRTNVCGPKVITPTVTQAPSSPVITNELSSSLIQPNPLTELQQKVYTGVSEAAEDLGVPQHIVAPKPKPTIVSPALKPHKCPKCENRFGTYQALNAHVKIHNKVNPYTCNVCDRIFIGKKELIRHKKLHTEGEVESSSKTVKHDCSVCGLFFNSEQELANHFVLHVEEKPFACEQFACEQCNSSFTTISELLLHRKQHEPQQPQPQQQPQQVAQTNNIEATYSAGTNKIVLYTTGGTAKPIIVQYGQQEDLNASRDSGLGDVTDQAQLQGQGQVMTILSVVEKGNYVQAECPTLDEIIDNLNVIDAPPAAPSPVVENPATTPPSVDAQDEPDGSEKMAVSYDDEDTYGSQEARDSPMTVTSSTPSCDSPLPLEEPPQEKVATITGGFIELQPMPFPGQGSILYQCSFCQENFINSDNLMMHVKMGHLNGDSQAQNFTQHALLAASL